MTGTESLPTDLAAAHAMILAERAARREAEAEAALVGHLKLEIEKLRRQLYGSRSERKARLLEQMELQLEELEATATEDELAAQRAAAQTQTVKPFQRKRPLRKPFPDHLPRERVVIAAPESCPCCGSSKLSKLGEDITETLEIIPRQWKVIQTVREKFSCRDCETITQPPAPFHVTPRGFAGPNLLAMILFEKFGQHQPLHRQSERYRREGIDLSLSTLADQVGACTVALQPLHALIERHVLAAERLHGDDTNVPILAKGQTIKGHIWTYVRDDRPFGGRAPPAALFYASRDRRHEHPVRHLAGFTGILQADAYGGYNELYEPSRAPGPITPALCWAHLWMPPRLQEPYRRFWRKSAAAVIYPACHGDAPRAAGPDGKSASRNPITLRELKARCAQRVRSAPVSPISPSHAERPSHLRRPFEWADVEQYATQSAAAASGILRHVATMPMRSVPSCWRRPRPQHWRAYDPANALARSTIVRASA